MIDYKIREMLPEESLVFDDPAFDHSIIGVTVNDEVVYDYYRMVDEFIEDNPECTPDDAIEFIDFNTIRALDSSDWGGNPKPIIMELLSYEVV